MSSAATATVRPRPRPKPKLKQPVGAPAASGSQDGQSLTPGNSSSSIKNISYETVQDNDEMFVKNRGRDKLAWAQLEKISRENEKALIVVDSDSDSDRSPRRKTAATRRKKGGDVSRLEKTKKLARLLSQDLSDSEGSVEIQETGDSQNKLNRRREDKKRRSRSRSITPPPDIPEYLLQNAKKIVRETYRTQARAASPTQYNELDESTDTIVLDPELDPELEKIAQNVKSQSELLRHRVSSAPLEDSSGGDETITITVRWQPHPLNEFGKQNVWGFKLNKSDNFSELFESVAEEASILASNLVMLFRGKRFFPSVTPNTLHILREAEFTACDQATHDYIRKNATAQIPIQPQEKPPKRKNSNPNVIELDSELDEDVGVQQSFENEADAGAESQTETGGGGGEDDKFKLTLRSGKTSKDITLVVRPTTKCGAIVKAFLKKAGLAEEYPAVMNGDGDGASKPSPKKKRKKAGTAAEEKIPMLCVDGDKVSNDTEIGEMDLEDGDMIEVVGL